MISSRVRRAAFVLLLSACSGGGDDGTGPDETPGGGGAGGGGQVLSGTIDVRMTGSAFIPANITITRGSKVRWLNDSGVFHTVTPETATQTGGFQRQTTSSNGLVFEHTFDTAAQTYRYRCEPHSSSFTAGMVGSIQVQ